ncbi:unnamed protein product [Blepharisma stoltei]|uniref:Dynein light chain n=1 Tax=Blepharisma stoltei TaxID=1481888 RepID=A0AAU9KE95_9CILI|nr:unnamed protein product [Blepharisma stoltei]
MSLGNLSAVVKIDEMEPEMKDFAIETAINAISGKSTEKEIASHIKKIFEDRYQPHWHCIVGRHFGAHVTFEARNYIYFYIGPIGILLFKSA